MKRQSNLVRVASLATVLALVAPSFAFAATPVAGGAFCANFSTLSARITANIPKRDDFRTQNVDDRVAKINNTLQLHVTKLDDGRDVGDKDRKARYAKLEASATTSAEQAAVKTYESTIDAAIATRRAAVDAAVATFQSSVNAMLTSRQTQIDTAFATLTSSTQAAIATASAACASKTDSATVRTQFSASIKAANTAFRAAVKPTNVRSSLEALRTTRDAAVKSAEVAFKTTAQQATTALKAAFGK